LDGQLMSPAIALPNSAVHVMTLSSPPQPASVSPRASSSPRMNIVRRMQ
jgi:hypothetical protein